MQKTKPIAIGGLGIIATANCEFAKFSVLLLTPFHAQSSAHGRVQL